MQLDLFGNPITSTTPSLSKEKDKIVFANNQVTVKVKSEKTTTPNIEIINEIIEERIEEVIVETHLEIIKEVIEDVIEDKTQSLPLNNSSNNTIQKKGKRGRKSYSDTYADVEDIDVPNDDELKNKLYYSISEVATWFKVTNSQIRFWENEFDILKPRKNRKGDRLFRVEDIKNLKIIYYLLRTRKFSIEGAKEYLKANKQNTNSQVQLKDTLMRFKSFLLEIKINLEK